MFLREEKQKLGKKIKLDMSVMNMKWKNMTDIQREPYKELYREDKLKLGDNYRRDRKKKKVVVVSEVKKVKNCKESMMKKGQPMDKAVSGAEQHHELPSIFSLLEELKEVDDQLVQKMARKCEKIKTIVQSQTKFECELKEIADLDTSLTSFQNKCNVLKKEIVNISMV